MELVRIFIENVSFIFKMFIIIVFISILSSIFISIIIIVILFIILSILVVRLWLATTTNPLSSVQLIENVLNLSLQLFITVAHHLILQHLLHAQCMSLLLQRLTSQNGIQCTIHMSTDYHIFMFYQLGKHLQHQVLWHLFTLGLTSASQRKIHQQCSCVLQAIFR